MNIWFCTLLFLPPALMLSATPESSHRWRKARMLLSIVAVYITLNMALDLYISRKWNAYEQCCSKLDDPLQCELEINVKPVRKCPPAPNSGAPEVFHLFFGWIPAISYTGLWELLWRIRYRARIRKLAPYTGALTSNILILFAALFAYHAYFFLTGPASW